MERENKAFNNFKLLQSNSKGSGDKDAFRRQPYAATSLRGQEISSVRKLRKSDTIMNASFWIGVYQGIDEEMLTYFSKMFDEFMRLHTKS